MYCFNKEVLLCFILIESLGMGLFNTFLFIFAKKRKKEKKKKKKAEWITDIKVVQNQTKREKVCLWSCSWAWKETCLFFLNTELLLFADQSVSAILHIRLIFIVGHLNMYNIFLLGNIINSMLMTVE